MDKNKFKEIASDWLALHTMASISAVGASTGNGSVVFSAKVRIGPVDDLPFSEEMNSPVIWAKRERVEISRDSIQSIIGCVLEEKVSVMGEVVPLLKPYDDRYSTYFDEARSHRYSNAEATPRELKYVVRGGRPDTFLSNEMGIGDITWNLRALDTPYADLYELCEIFEVPTISDGAVVELTVSPPAIFSSTSHISTDTAVLTLGAVKQINRGLVKIGYIAAGKEVGSIRGSIVKSDITWRFSENGWIGEAKIKTGDAPYVDLFLSYDGVITHSMRLHNKERHMYSPRAIYSAFDPDLAALSDSIFNCKKSAARTFEDAISILFHMLGFSIAHYGGISSLSETAPDIVAITPSRSVMVIECTLGLPDQGDQVAKVLQRTEIVRKALSKSGWGDLMVYPVVVTNLPDSEIATHREAAEGNGVSVICREALEGFISELAGPADADRILDEITQCVRNPIFYKAGKLNGF